MAWPTDTGRSTGAYAGGGAEGLQPPPSKKEEGERRERKKKDKREFKRGRKFNGLLYCDPKTPTAP